MKDAAFELDIDRLWLEIVLYLEFLDVAHEEDSLWQEYVAWKELTERRAKAKLSA